MTEIDAKRRNGEAAYLAALMSCVDGPVSFFGGRSLRVVCGEADGAERVARWLVNIENGDIQEAALSPLSPSPRATFDHAPVWAALGLMDHRRRYLAAGSMLDARRVLTALRELAESDASAVRDGE